MIKVTCFLTYKYIQPRLIYIFKYKTINIKINIINMKKEESTEERLKYYQEFYEYNLTHPENGLGLNNLVVDVIQDLKKQLRREKLHKIAENIYNQR